MNKSGMSQVGAFTPDNLIAGNRHPVDICHVVIKAGQNLKRGTVVGEDMEEKGKYVILGTQGTKSPAPVDDAVSEGEQSKDTGSDTENSAVEAEYILAEDVDASEEDTVGAAYCTGEFAENVLIVKEGYTISDTDRKALRNAGIFLKTIMM